MILSPKIWFGGEKNDFHTKKVCFCGDFGVKKGFFEKIVFFFIFFQNFIFDQGFDSNGPGGAKLPKRQKIIKIKKKQKIYQIP